MSIYDLPLVVADALAQALTPSNIMSGFRAAGIMPFNRGIFQESAFLSSYVTDHEDTLPCKETDFGTLVGGPTRPALHNYYPKTNVGKQNRALSATQYDSYDFVEYSISSDAVFCFPCRHFTPSTAYKDIAFTEKSVIDWNKIKDKPDKHGSTHSHMDSMTRWNEYKNSLKMGLL